MFGYHLSEDIFRAVTDVEGVIHVGSFLEFPRPDESVVSMPRACDPSDVVVCVEITASLRFFLREQLITTF